MPPRWAWASTRNVSYKALRPDTGERWPMTFSGEGYEHKLLEWLKKLTKPARCAYESGCTGFWMSRFLTDEGVACEVMAVSTLPRLSKNKPHKAATVNIRADIRHHACLTGDHKVRES